MSIAQKKIRSMSAENHDSEAACTGNPRHRTIFDIFVLHRRTDQGSCINVRAHSGTARKQAFTIHPLLRRSNSQCRKNGLSGRRRRHLYCDQYPLSAVKQNTFLLCKKRKKKGTRASFVNCERFSARVHFQRGHEPHEKYGFPPFYLAVVPAFSGGQGLTTTTAKALTDGRQSV